MLCMTLVIISQGRSVSMLYFMFCYVLRVSDCVESVDVKTDYEDGELSTNETKIKLSAKKSRF